MADLFDRIAERIRPIGPVLAPPVQPWTDPSPGLEELDRQVAAVAFASEPAGPDHRPRTVGLPPEPDVAQQTITARSDTARVTEVQWRAPIEPELRRVDERDPESPEKGADHSPTLRPSLASVLQQLDAGAPVVGPVWPRAVESTGRESNRASELAPDVAPPVIVSIGDIIVRPRAHTATRSSSHGGSLSLSDFLDRRR